jgi:hypothetical protein
MPSYDKRDLEQWDYEERQRQAFREKLLYAVAVGIAVGCALLGIIAGLVGRH